MTAHACHAAEGFLQQREFVFARLACGAVFGLFAIVTAFTVLTVTLAEVVENPFLAAALRVGKVDHGLETLFIASCFKSQRLAINRQAATTLSELLNTRALQSLTGYVEALDPVLPSQYRDGSADSHRVDFATDALTEVVHG